MEQKLLFLIVDIRRKIIVGKMKGPVLFVQVFTFNFFLTNSLAQDPGRAKNLKLSFVVDLVVKKEMCF